MRTRRRGRAAATGTAVGVFILASVWPAWAQQPAFTVTFSGEMRVHGILFDNLTDFTDTERDPARFKDSNAHFFQRWRLFTTVQSADKRAKAVWAVEVGDIVWGSGGGASGAEFGGVTTRVGPGTGGGLGADGVNVETKNLFVQFDVPFLPGTANLLLGIHNILLLTSPIGAFLDDDAAGIQFNWKLDPVDLQIWYAKADENARADADDNDLWAARLGVAVTKDLRVTVEGLVMNQQCFARRADGKCAQADFAETFWVGGTASARVGRVQLDGTVVYGQRQLFSAARQANVEEAGWGAQVTARVPFGPLTTWWNGWYTTGDDNRIPGSRASAFRDRGPGQDFSTVSNTTRLNGDSDKLPVPIALVSWLGAPFQAELMLGARTVGVPAVGSPLYLDPTGTWSVGVSGIYALTPALSVGAGYAFLAATEDNGIFGDHVHEFDAGLTYTYNANLSFQGIAGYVIPEKGDDAWGVWFRTRFVF